MLGENEALPSPQVQTRVPKGLDQEDDWQRDSPPPWGQSPYPHLARLLGWWPGIFSNCAEEVTSSPGSARPAGRALQDRQLFLCQDSGAIYQGDKQQPEGRVGGRSCLGEITGGHSEGAKGITSPPWGHPGPAPSLLRHLPLHLLTSPESLATLEQGARASLGHGACFFSRAVPRDLPHHPRGGN